VFVNSALDIEVLEDAGIDAATTLLTITNNGDINAVVAQQAQEEFQLPRIVSVVPKEDTKEDKNTKKSSNKKAVSGQKTASPRANFPIVALKVWNSHLREGAVRLGETLLKAEGALMQRAHLRALMRSGNLIPLVVKRGDRMWVSLKEDEDWKAGDRIVYLLHESKPKLLQRLSGGSRPARLNIETIRAVEEVPRPTRVTNASPPPDPSVEAPPATQPKNGEVLPDSSQNGRATAPPKLSDSPTDASSKTKLGEVAKDINS
jgi:Trk K+ transport system NAD-binding subunit